MHNLQSCVAIRGIASAWNNWSPCSRTCGLGKQTRRRICSTMVCAGMRGKRTFQTRQCTWSGCCPGRDIYLTFVLTVSFNPLPLCPQLTVNGPTGQNLQDALCPAAWVSSFVQGCAIRQSHNAEERTVEGQLDNTRNVSEAIANVSVSPVD